MLYICIYHFLLNVMWPFSANQRFQIIYRNDKSLYFIPVVTMYTRRYQLKFTKRASGITIVVFAHIIQFMLYPYKYRITSVLKVEIYIIINVTASPIGRTVIFVVMHFETSKTDLIVFIGINRLNVTSHWPIISSLTISSLMLTILLGK